MYVCRTCTGFDRMSSTVAHVGTPATKGVHACMPRRAHTSSRIGYVHVACCWSYARSKTSSTQHAARSTQHAAAAAAYHCRGAAPSRHPTRRAAGRGGRRPLTETCPPGPIFRTFLLGGPFRESPATCPAGGGRSCPHQPRSTRRERHPRRHPPGRGSRARRLPQQDLQV